MFISAYNDKTKRITYFGSKAQANQLRKICLDEFPFFFISKCLFSLVKGSNVKYSLVA